MAVQPGVGGFQHGTCLVDTVRIAIGFGAQLVVYELLLRPRNVVVEEAVEHAHIDGGIGVGGNQSLWPRTMGIEVFDDAGGLHDLAVAVHQQRKFPDRPAPR
ncbi:MAG TPA: hypothetical protein VFM52_00770, partial [Rhodanobacter sp.]|nr:hypothetical protein [Rhodanobacter sp.]